MSRRAALSKISRALGTFPLYEVRTLVIPSFPDLSWKTVKRELMDNKMNANSQSIRKILLKRINDLRTPSLEDIYLNLIVQAVAHHSERKLWQVYRLEGNGNDDMMDLNKLHTNLLRQCRINHADSGVVCLKHDSFVWMGITEKVIVRRRGMVWKKPVIFAVIPEENYIYATGSVSTILLTVVSQALEYERATIYKLSGHSITSLHTLLLQKESNAFNEDLTTTNFIKEPPREFNGGTDYTQHDSRRRYAEKAYNEKVKLDKFVIQASNVKLRSNLPELDGLKDLDVPFSLTFKSNNLAKTFKEMAEMSALNLSKPPDYFQMAQSRGKLIITVSDS